MTNSSNPVIGVRLPEAIYKATLEVAKKEFGGTSEYVRELLRNNLRERGYLSVKAEKQDESDAANGEGKA